MLQLSSCGPEQVKSWRKHNIFWKGIPLDNSQGKAGIFIGILASVNLTECHRMAISGYPMGGVRDGNYAIYNFIEETETGLISSLF